MHVLRSIVVQYHPLPCFMSANGAVVGQVAIPERIAMPPSPRRAAADQRSASSTLAIAHAR